VSDNYLAKLIGHASTRDEVLVESDKAKLKRVYSKGKERLPFINRLTFALERKGFLRVLPTSDSKVVSVCLLKENMPGAFFDEHLFANEFQNIELIKSAFSRVRTVSLETFLENLFRINGVPTWLD
jgi:hypothetical protein